MNEVPTLYRDRFGSDQQKSRIGVWKVLCRHFFQRYIRESDAVLDLGAGYCEFINNIRCKAKYAVDINEDTRLYAEKDITVYIAGGFSLPMFSNASLDVVFCSNFFEHLTSKDEILLTLAEIHRILRLDGKLLILQPNIKYLCRSYWDFFDHHIPLSHLSMMEALHSQGFKVTELVPRFLPYTTKSRLPKAPILVRAYLRLPFLYRILGGQMFIEARPGKGASVS